MAQLLTPHALMYAAAGPIFLTMLVIMLRLWRVSRHRMTALNNMSQGLCMFDAAGRIMVRNQPYLTMYNLKPEVVKVGCTLRDLIEHRKKTGYFQGNVEEYCRNILDSVAKGKPFAWTIEASDGRIVNVVNTPMADRRLGRDPRGRDRAAQAAAAARRDGRAGKQARHDRRRNPELPRTGRERSQIRRRERRHDEVDRDQAARRLGPDLAAGDQRAACIERGLDQCDDRRDRNG